MKYVFGSDYYSVLRPDLQSTFSPDEDRTADNCLSSLSANLRLEYEREKENNEVTVRRSSSFQGLR